MRSVMELVESWCPRIRYRRVERRLSPAETEMEVRRLLGDTEIACEDTVLEDDRPEPWNFEGEEDS